MRSDIIINKNMSEKQIPKEHENEINRFNDAQSKKLGVEKKLNEEVEIGVETSVSEKMEQFEGSKAQLEDKKSNSK